MAEIIAVVTPQNNGKLATDLLKLATRPERHRYVFFMSSLFRGKTRLPQFEQHEVQVWSVDAYSQLVAISGPPKPRKCSPFSCGDLNAKTAPYRWIGFRSLIRWLTS